MTYIPDYRVLHNPGAVFRPSKTIKNVPAKVKTVKIRDALPSDYSDIINDASMEVERITLEMSKRPTWIPQSDKAPLVRTRTDVATAKLMGDIDAVIDRSKRISIKSTEVELYDLESISSDGSIYETLIEPAYAALPHHISVHSTKPPRIIVHAQRPEQTRNHRSFALERRQPDVEVVPRCNEKWKLGFHGQQLKYAEGLIKKHGAGINRYFRCGEPTKATEALCSKVPCDVGGAMEHYRRELRRQSELKRAAKADDKWWEDRTSKFHYNCHKNKLANMTADLDRLKHHQQMVDNYVTKIDKCSRDFWA